jgi:hypothetical protein
MNKKNSAAVFVTVLACLAALMPTNAYAYLDPGTGTFAVQGLIAGIAGSMIALRAYGRRFLGLFRRTRTSEWPEDPTGNGRA